MNMYVTMCAWEGERKRDIYKHNHKKIKINTSSFRAQWIMCSKSGKQKK
jgi:hypothetical protein